VREGGSTSRSVAHTSELGVIWGNPKAAEIAGCGSVPAVQDPRPFAAPDVG
jgi:hypothetical protein